MRNVTPAADGHLIGRPILRQEDPRLLTGKGLYVTDLSLPGLLHLALVRSQHAHARVLAIDAAAARRLPGVVAVYGAADLEDVAPLPVLTHPPGQRQTGFP